MTPGCYMAKVDIKSAYRAVATNQHSWSYAGIKWTLDGEDVYIVDRRLPFGARASPSHFHRLSQSIKRMMLRRGFNKIVAYQDDFLVLGDTKDECMEAWSVLMNLITSLGFEINKEKAERPAQTIIFLGIQLNSTLMQLSLPTEKLEKIRATLRQFKGKERATKRQLQSIAGKLNHAAKVVHGGRTFLRRIITCIGKLREGHHTCRLTGSVKKDITWWHNFMATFNGVSACIDSSLAVSVVTDACLDSGGAFYNGDFYYTNWQQDFPNIAKLPINYKEAAMAALCINRWAPQWRNRLVYLYSDNQCTVSIINKCTCKSNTVMSLLRQNFWTAAQNNVHVKAIYLPGVRNSIADMISRLHDSPDRLYSLESTINDWALCHFQIPDAFQYYSLCNHMSMASLLTLQGHSAWRSQRWPWIKQFGYT